MSLSTCTMRHRCRHAHCACRLSTAHVPSLGKCTFRSSLLCVSSLEFNQVEINALFLQRSFFLRFFLRGNRKRTVKKCTLKMRPRKMKCSDFFSRPSKAACENLDYSREQVISNLYNDRHERNTVRGTVIIMSTRVVSLARFHLLEDINATHVSIYVKT